MDSESIAGSDETEAEITVILDEGCGQFQEAVSRFAPVQVFRRVNGFRSPAGVAAAELLGLLEQQSLVGRAIYIAPSFAGFTALLSADRHPDSLLGALLLDPSHPRQGPEALKILSAVPSAPDVERLRTFLTGFGPAWDDSCHEVAALTDLNQLTIHILAGGKFDLPAQLSNEIKTRLMTSRLAMLKEYCALSRDSSFVIVDQAGHDLARQAPETVINAIKRLLEAVKHKHSRR